MSGHAYHEGHPGYHPEQILHDDCPECSRRGRDIAQAVNALDPATFARAWERAAQWQLHGLPGLSETEMPLLNALRAVQMQFERRGVPIGALPMPVEVVLS